MLATGLPVIAAPVTVTGEPRTGSPRRPIEEARFEAFYRQTSPGLWSYLFRLTGDSSAADDLLQKAFFRFLQNSPIVSSDEHMRAWLFRTATNLAFDHFREMRRERRDRDRAAADVVSSMEPRELLRHDMMRTFAELKPRERALLWLAHVEEAGHEDIGEALGVTRGSVKVLLFRARKRLAELLTRKGFTPEGRR